MERSPGGRGAGGAGGRCSREGGREEEEGVEVVVVGEEGVDSRRRDAERRGGKRERSGMEWSRARVCVCVCWKTRRWIRLPELWTEGSTCRVNTHRLAGAFISKSNALSLGACTHTHTDRERKRDMGGETVVMLNWQLHAERCCYLCGNVCQVVTTPRPPPCCRTFA